VNNQKADTCESAIEKAKYELSNNGGRDCYLGIPFKEGRVADSI
jgi:hypothetical protein